MLQLLGRGETFAIFIEVIHDVVHLGLLPWLRIKISPMSEDLSKKPE